MIWAISLLSLFLPRLNKDNKSKRLRTVAPRYVGFAFNARGTDAKQCDVITYDFSTKRSHG